MIYLYTYLILSIFSYIFFRWHSHISKEKWTLEERLYTIGFVLIWPIAWLCFLCYIIDKIKKNIDWQKEVKW